MKRKPRPIIRVRHPLWSRGKYPFRKAWEWEVLWADGAKTPEVHLAYAYDHPEYLDLFLQGTAV